MPVSTLSADDADDELAFARHGSARRARLDAMTPPHDHPLHALGAVRNGDRWLDLLTAELDATTPEASAALRLHEERINHELDEIEAGRHPLCHPKPAT